jgi:hypothetical protein
MVIPLQGRSLRSTKQQLSQTVAQCRHHNGTQLVLYVMLWLLSTWCNSEECQICWFVSRSELSDWIWPRISRVTFSFVANKSFNYLRPQPHIGVPSDRHAGTHSITRKLCQLAPEYWCRHDELTMISCRHTGTTLRWNMLVDISARARITRIG